MPTASQSRPQKRNFWLIALRLAVLILLPLAAALHAQTCLGGADMEAAAKASLEAAAKRYFEMSSRDNAEALKQNSISSLAANFAGVENVLKDNQPAFTGSSATVRNEFLLTAEGSQPVPRAEFLCGVFGKSGQTSSSAVFVLNNLPPGKYGIAILDVSGGKKPLTLTLVLEQSGADWKLAGYYARSPQAAGHDGAWFVEKAREFKSKSQNHNAWLYYREAMALAAPVDFMSTQATDRLYDEVEANQPTDVPVNGNEIELNTGGKTYRWSAIFPMAVGDDIDVVVKYSSSDISNTAITFADNMQVIKALVAKFPELKSAFAGVVARAVAPNGEDYGSLLPMKEVK